MFRFPLESEYGVPVQIEKLPYEVARWVVGEGLDRAAIDRDPSTLWCEDRAGHPVVLFKSEWAMNWLAERNPKVELRETAL